MVCDLQCFRLSYLGSCFHLPSSGLLTYVPAEKEGRRGFHQTWRGLKSPRGWIFGGLADPGLGGQRGKDLQREYLRKWALPAPIPVPPSQNLFDQSMTHPFPGSYESTCQSCSLAYFTGHYTVFFPTQLSTSPDFLSCSFLVRRILQLSP